MFNGCVTVCTFIHVRVRVYPFTHVRVYPFMHVRVRVYLFIHVCERVYPFIHVRIRVSIFFDQHFFVYMYIYFHTFKCLRRGFLTTRTAHPSIPNSLTARIHQQTSFLNRRGWGTEKFIKGSQRMLRESLESSSSETAALVGSSGTLLVARLLAYSCVTFCWD